MSAWPLFVMVEQRALPAVEAVGRYSVVTADARAVLGPGPGPGLLPRRCHLRSRALHSLFLGLEVAACLQVDTGCGGLGRRVCTNHLG